MSSLPLPIAAFFAGLISFLSPCVLPLVPGYVSLISGASVEELKEQDSRLMRTVFLNSLMFILGFSIVFLALGAAATTVGHVLHKHLALMSKIAGVIIIIFGLHLTGLVPIKALYADKRMHGLKTNSTAAGAFLVGFAFAFGWSPCIGPILGPILQFASKEDTVGKGMLLLAVYSLGLAVPFLLTSLGIDRFLAFYGRFRRHLHMVEVVSGVLLIFIGVLIFSRNFAMINSWLDQFSFFRTLEKFL
ncbi:MAG TPA: cytochrome c biogenesis protein CcdA [Terriglobales bacterium]|nr:cytochrome c biogenesis protein CcdA [Terriglobales bacterium]